MQYSNNAATAAQAAVIYHYRQYFKQSLHCNLNTMYDNDSSNNPLNLYKKVYCEYDQVRPHHIKPKTCTDNSNSSYLSGARTFISSIHKKAQQYCLWRNGRVVKYVRNDDESVTCLRIYLPDWLSNSEKLKRAGAANYPYMVPFLLHIYCNSFTSSYKTSYNHNKSSGINENPDNNSTTCLLPSSYDVNVIRLLLVKVLQFCHCVLEWLNEPRKSDLILHLMDVCAVDEVQVVVKPGKEEEAASKTSDNAAIMFRCKKYKTTQRQLIKTDGQTGSVTNLLQKVMAAIQSILLDTKATANEQQKHHYYLSSVTSEINLKWYTGSVYHKNKSTIVIVVPVWIWEFKDNADVYHTVYLTSLWSWIHTMLCGIKHPEMFLHLNDDTVVLKKYIDQRCANGHDDGFKIQSVSIPKDDETKAAILKLFRISKNDYRMIAFLRDLLNATNASMILFKYQWLHENKYMKTYFKVTSKTGTLNSEENGIQMFELFQCIYNGLERLLSESKNTHQGAIRTQSKDNFSINNGDGDVYTNDTSQLLFVNVPRWITEETTTNRMDPSKLTLLMSWLRLLLCHTTTHALHQSNQPCSLTKVGASSQNNNRNIKKKSLLVFHPDKLSGDVDKTLLNKFSKYKSVVFQFIAPDHSIKRYFIGKQKQEDQHGGGQQGNQYISTSLFKEYVLNPIYFYISKM